MKPRLMRWIAVLKENLFGSIPNAVFTLLLVWGLAVVTIGFLDWALFNAVWRGESRDVAVVGGATWAYIAAKIRFYLYGFYPPDQIWRINLYCLLMLASLAPLVLRIKAKLWICMSYFLVWPLLTVVLVSGGLGLTEVSSKDWGGLSLTLILSLLGLLCSFPLGVLAALGRRSRLPVIRGLSTAYIEFFRGIPLITILFMSSVVVPFFLPAGVTIDKIVRVVVGMSLFQSAYLAEVLRGGFQSVPKSQFEAADSLGMSYFQKTALVIMPQVLKATISNIGGISISFIKDTTLVLIIGMFDLLGMVGPTSADTDWLGMEPEGYVFAGLVYWAICFAVSKTTAVIERRAHALPAATAR